MYRFFPSQENNKSPNRNQFVTPKSPLRKSKANRVSKTNKALQYNELNEKNNRERSSLIESMTTAETNAIISNNAQNLVILQKQSVGTYCYLSNYFFPQKIICCFQCTFKQHKLGNKTESSVYSELTCMNR